MNAYSNMSFSFMDMSYTSIPSAKNGSFDGDALFLTSPSLMTNRKLSRRGPPWIFYIFKEFSKVLSNDKGSVTKKPPLFS